MKISRVISLLVLVLIAQIAFSAMFSLQAVNLAKYPYHRSERIAAMRAYEADPSTEKKAAYMEEVHLAARHCLRAQLTKAGGVFLGFVGVDSIFIYGWRRYRTAPSELR